MKEYHSTRKFSPVLEAKKLLNLENFFLVNSTQEKYKILNSVFRKSTLPAMDFYPEVEKKEQTAKLKGNKLSPPGLFKRKLSKEDREVEKMIQFERMKEIEEAQKLEKFQFKASKKMKANKIQTRTKGLNEGAHRIKSIFYLDPQ